MNGEKNRLFIRNKSGLNKYIGVLTAICAFIIAISVLLYPPMPGVADQGDFQRVMTVTGLQEISSDTQDPHWFKYVTTNYKMVSLNPARLLGVIPTTSMIYPITLARIVCKLAGNQYFNTRVLASVYIIMYIICVYVITKNIEIKRISASIFFSFLSLLILMDGNYLVWFNSLYGEPMMIIGLLAFIGSILYFSRHMEKPGYKGFFLVCVSALLFLGSKAQCLPALPLILLMIIRIAMLKHNKYLFSKKMNMPLTAAILILIFYAGGTYVQISSTCGIDTAYNSVFYGILKNSKSPEADLNMLGLSSDMAVEAGKHAYLPREKYAKYVPWSSLTIKEFNEKISNLKLLKFYLFQPGRLLKGMEYTASQSFNTRGFLGKYERSAGVYAYTFNRFTLWSDFRNTVLPKKLIFIAAFYLLIILVSILEYTKRRSDQKEALIIWLLWVIIFISLLQFPMPYVGNGEADTGKQLFLFNYTFDLLFLVSAVWIFDRVCYLIQVCSRHLDLRNRLN